MASISSSRSNTIISSSNSGEGDRIINNGSRVTVAGGIGNDTIYGYAYYASINAGEGDNYIYSNGRYSTIQAGDGNDTLYQSTNGDGSHINLGGGNDSIYSYDEDSSTLDGGDGDDTIQGRYWTSSISGGRGNDRISLGGGGNNNTVNAGEGDDTIYADTINGGRTLIQYSLGDGSDIIYGFRENSTLQIMQGGGISAISNVSTDSTDVFLTFQDGAVVTLSGAHGKYALKVIDIDGNEISLSEFEGDFNTVYSGGGGNDIIALGNSPSSQITKVKVVTDGGDDTVTSYWNSSSDNYFDVGDGNDYVSNNGPRTTILGGAGNDQIYTCPNATEDVVDAGEGNDYVNVGGDRVYVDGGAGNDRIKNHGNKGSLIGGAGNDSVSNEGNEVSISLGEGKDSVYSYGEDVSIDGGEGNDYIYSSGAKASIDGGEDENTILLNGNNSTVKVSEGNDTILVGTGVTNFTVQDFGTGDVIRLAEQVDELEKSGEGIRAGSVLISGLKNDKVKLNSWLFEDGVATYVEATYESVSLLNDGRTIVYGEGKALNKTPLVTVRGVTSTNGLDIDTEKKAVIVSISSLSQEKTVTVSDGYELALGRDVPEPHEYEGEGWRFSGTTATYKNASTTEGYVLENNRITYQSEGEGETVVTVEGVISTEGLALEDKTVTVSQPSLSKDLTVKVSEGYTLALGQSESVNVNNDGWIYDEEEKTASYVKGSRHEYYEVNDDGEIEYVIEDQSETLVTITGITSIDGLDPDFDNKVITVSEASLSEDSVVTVSDGYTLKLGDDAPTPTVADPDWDYRGSAACGRIETTSAGYKVDNNQIVFVRSGSNETVVVYGVSTMDSSADGLSVSGNVVTVSEAALNGVDGPIRVSNGYTLALGDDITGRSTFTEPSRSLVNGTMTYRGGERTRGWEVVDNQITIIPKIDSLNIEITNVISAAEDAIERDGNKNFIIHAAALNEEAMSGEHPDFRAVEITYGYTLSLGDDVKKPQKGATKGWELDGTKAIYNSGGRTSGFLVAGEDNDSITYDNGEENKVWVEISGVKSTDGLLLTKNSNESVVSVYESALNGEDITINEGSNFILELMNEEDLISTSTTDWMREDQKVVWQEGGQTEGYYLKDDKTIKHQDAVVGTVKLELTGVDVTPEMGFTDEDDDEDSENGKDFDVVKFGFDNFTEGGISVLSNEGGYRFEITEDVYNEETKFIGFDGKDSITNYGANVIIEGRNGIDVIDNDADDVTIDGGAGNDRITTVGRNVSINAGKGNDNVTLSGSDEDENVFVYASNDGKDHVYNFNKNDKLQFLGNAAKTATADVQNSDVVFKIGTGSITLHDAVKKHDTDEEAIEIVIIDQNGDETELSRNTYTEDGVVSDRKDEERERQIVLKTSFEGEYTASSSINRTGYVTIVDGTQVQKGASLNAGVEGESLIGGAGKDTFISGSREFSMKGGKGNDVFVFNGGKGTIADYSQKGTYGKDRVVIAAGLSFTGYTMEGSNVVLEYGESNYLTLESAENKEISFGTKASDPVYSYNTNGIFDSNGKSATLASGVPYFLANKNYAKLETIDGSMTEVVEIVGNKKANYIISGKSKSEAGGSTLNGGKGTDTLVGGAGQDTFVYENKSGNKLIRNYDFDHNDIISLGGGAELSEVKNKGKDLELKVGSNKITIEGGANNAFKFVDGEEKTFTAKGLLTVGNSASMTSAFAGTEFNLADEEYTNFNASLVKKNLTINGDGAVNSLVGSKGNDTLTAGSGGASLWGGKGNDLLIGDVSEDTFIFHAGDGNDTIRGFGAGLDKLEICDKRGQRIEKNAYTGSVFNTNKGTLTLTIKGGGKLILEGMHQGDSVSVNGQSRSITGKKLV